MSAIEEFPVREEIVVLSRADRKIKEMATLTEFPGAIVFNEIDRRQMRDELKKSGASVEYVTPKILESLAGTQFRGMGQDRGEGFVAILGIDRTKEVLKLCDELSVKEPRFKNEFSHLPTEWSRSRGHYQLAADLLTIAITDDEKVLRKVHRRMNRRLWKWARKELKDEPFALTRLDRAMMDFGIPMPDKDVSRAIPENAYKIWMAMTGRNIEPESHD